MSHALIVSTSAASLAGTPTGVWLEEVAAPYYAFKQVIETKRNPYSLAPHTLIINFSPPPTPSSNSRDTPRASTPSTSPSLSLYQKKKAGYTVTLASPAGGPIPVDAASRSGDFYTPAAKRFDADEDTKAMLAASKKVVDLDPTGVDVVFVAGGHGAVADLATDQTVAAFLVAVADAGRAPVASVCHGVVALLSSDACAAHFVKGKRLTGFSDAEEVAVGKVELMGGADKTLEARLKAAGGLYTAGPDWAPHVVVDGKVVTGQNPASSAATAVAAVKAAAESLTPAVEAGGE
jgi:putative intracellular protease/amidase